MMIILALLVAYLFITKGFYISLNKFNWSQAETYCTVHCHSHLVSIHNDDQYQQLINTIKLSRHDQVIQTAQNIYIGLSDITTPGHFTWSDNTLFDFGNNISGGIYPWNYGHPQISSKCSIIHFSVLTKYAIITETDTRSSQSARCHSIYNTQLMSMHSYKDFEEGITICDLMPIHSCYIGLYWNHTLHSYLWDDGTTVNNALQFIPSESSTNCTIIDELSTQCTGDQYGICNLPSEICYIDQWVFISGNTYSFSTDQCQVINSYNGVAIIGDKRWNNNGKNVIFEYIYTMFPSQTDESTAGVIWHIDTSCSKYYYIGISITDNVVFLALVFNDVIHYIKRVSFMYNAGTFYVLKAEISTMNTFMIYINDDLLIHTTGSDDFNYIDTSIGYIGIKNTYSSIIGKSLFISGIIVISDDNVSLWFNECSELKTSPITTSYMVVISDDNGLFSLLSTESLIAIAVVTLLLCFFCCCVLYTLNRVCNGNKNKKEEDSRHATNEEMVNIQINSKHQPIIRVKAVEDSPLSPMDTQQNMANEFERAMVAAWLENDVGLPQYYKVFIRNGYESMRIIKEIEDRTQLHEIGITKLGHQTMIISEIQRYKIQSYVSGSVNATDRGTAGKKTTATFESTATTRTPDDTPIRPQPGQSVQPGQPGYNEHLGEKPQYASYSDDLFGTYIE